MYTEVDMLMCRLCGPAYDVARQLAGSATWGGMLVSEDVWQEQGNYSRLWVYNQGVSMSWGPIISCFALLPEGHAAYLHSSALPTLGTRSKPILKTLDDDDDDMTTRSMQVPWYYSDSALSRILLPTCCAQEKCPDLVAWACAGIGMPTMPCHSTAWQVRASMGGGTGMKAPRQVLQSVRPQPLHGEPPNPFAAKAASTKPAASC